MQSTTITPNLIKLTKWNLMNAYLVREDDGFTLIDTTMNAAGDLIAAATAAGAAIKRIALTHGHLDHAGSVDALRAKLGAEVPLLVPELDAHVLAGDLSGISGKKKGSWPKLSTAPDVLLHPGDTVGSLAVVASPGHTPGHVSFFDPRDRSLIAGDAYSSIGRVSVPSKAYWKFPLPATGTWDKPQALASAKALRALDPAVLVCGHGRAVSNPAAAMDTAISLG